jgi:hypothetical protein
MQHQHHHSTDQKKQSKHALMPMHTHMHRLINAQQTDARTNPNQVLRRPVQPAPPVTPTSQDLGRSGASVPCHASAAPAVVPAARADQMHAW